MVTPSYLNSCFKKEIGRSFVEYVSIVKMCKAKALLKNPRNKIYEVGLMLGYKDYFYFYQVFKKYIFFEAVKNSAVSTLIAMIVLTVICSMAAYVIARKNNRFYNTVYYIFIGAMIIPFQSIMTPLYINLKAWGLIDNILGFTLAKIGFQIAFTILIVTGFVKTIPVELEEAAAIDGAGQYGVFWKIVFPLMKPIVFTSVVLNALNVWNDFQVSVVVLQKVSVRTISLTQFYFFGENSMELGLAFAVFVLSMIPILILYLALQKYIISGITAGAVKG